MEKRNFKDVEDIEIEAMIWNVISKELKEPVDEFVLNREVRERLNLGEDQRNRVKSCIEKLHKMQLIISTYDEWFYSKRDGVFAIKAGSEMKYFANPDKAKK